MTWTGWRGPQRDGRAPSLPATLPPTPVVQWQVDLFRPGLGGLAATEGYVVLGDRDAEDFHDVWRCLDASSGQTLWEVQTLAIGELDYGNSPRTTPLLARRHVGGKPVPMEDRAYMLGALGDLLCVRLETGEILWRKNLCTDFQALGERPWGYCGSPLLVDNKLIVNPGAPQASLAALDPDTGAVVWTTPGDNLGYGSFIVATLGGKRQIVGHDATSLGGWEIETGKRLWQLIPPIEGDFNVPTPLPVHGKLLVATENNGVRLYAFDARGCIEPTPVARNDRLKPEMSTPVAVGSRLFCVDRFLYCLDLDDGLKELWRCRDPGLGDYSAVLADDKRLLIVGKGQVLLVDAAQEQQVIARWRVFDENTDIYSHAAVVGDRFFIRGERSLQCLSLK